MSEVRYMGALIGSLLRRSSAHGARRRVHPVLLVMLLLSAAAWTANDSSAAESRAARAEVEALQLRMERVSRHLDRTTSVYEAELAPLERVLLAQGADVRLARRVATALVAEARRNRLEPRLLLGVLLVENPWIDVTARSPVGAQGLMQVMPFHRGQWSPCEPRLDDIEANICHGARIFAAYLKSERGNLERALLRYNGCVRGTNTPNCHSYPSHVLARTGGATLHDWRQSRIAEPTAAP